MTSGRVRCRLAALAVFSILTIFFFRAVEDPYSVVHGPATTLLALRKASRLRFAIVQAALSSAGNRMSSSVLIWPSLVLFGLLLSPLDFSSLCLSESGTILRC
jgi:hypothetical protein